MKNILLLGCCLAAFSLAAQVPFSITPLVAEAEKPAQVDFLYNYVELINPTADTLQIRWKKLEGTGHGSGTHNPAAEWVTAITDPSNDFNPADLIETATFKLEPSGQIYEKFIYQLFPNNAEGELYQRISFSVDGQTNDSIVVIFDYKVTESDPPNKVETLEWAEIHISPNPTFNFLNINNPTDKDIQGLLTNLQGQQLQHFNISAGHPIQLNVIAYPPGLYLLELHNGNSRTLRKIIIGQ